MHSMKTTILLGITIVNSGLSSTSKLDNAESVVNMYVYIQGEELISGIDTIEELEELCNE